MWLLPKQKGFTLTEVLVAIAVLTLLASITFVLGAPSREKGRQTACAAQLGQIYEALTMYSDDCSAGQEFPGAPNLSLYALGNHDLLKPYVKEDRIFFCPDAPADAPKYIGDTYVDNLAPAELIAKDKNAAPLGPIQAMNLQKYGQRYPLFYCTVHDEVYYQPRETDISPLLAQPFIVEVQLNGNVAFGRRPWIRSRPILTAIYGH